MFSRNPKPQDLQAPVIAICSLEDLMVISTGKSSKGQEESENQLLVFKLASKIQEPLQRINTGNQLVGQIRINKHKNLLVTSQGNETVIYQVDQKLLKEVHRFRSEKEEYQIQTCGMPVQDDLSRILTGGESGILHYFEVSITEKFAIELQRYEGHTANILSIDVSPNKQFILSTSMDKSCKIWNINDGQCIHTLFFSERNQSPDMLFRSAVFSKPGDQILSICSGQKNETSYLTVWDFTEDQEPKAKISVSAHKGEISQAVLSEDGLFLGIGTANGFLKIFNTRTLEADAELKLHQMPVVALCFAYYGKLLLSGSLDSSYCYLPNVAKAGLFNIISKLWVFSLLLIWIYLYFFQGE